MVRAERQKHPGLLEFPVPDRSQEVIVISTDQGQQLCECWISEWDNTQLLHHILGPIGCRNF